MYVRPKMLFFGSPSCDRCIRYQVLLSKELTLHENNFKYVNGDDFDNKEIQDLCDYHNVDEYPHVKIYALNRCIYEEIADLNVKEIVRIMTNEVEIKDASQYTTGQSDKPQ